MEAAQLFEELFDDSGEAEEDGSENGEIALPNTLNKTALGILMAQINRFQQNPNAKFGHLPGPAASVKFLESAMTPTLGRNIAVNCTDILVRCDEKPLWESLMGHGFLVLFCFALIGNCINLLIYNSDQIRFFIAIRMLCTKLLMNTCMMVVMVPQALRVIRFWDIGGSTDILYWTFWPYQAYLTNVFGFCAMWLTVLMTAECYIHIFFPSKSKTLCTKQTVWRSYLIILFAALILASIYPLNRTVSLSNRCNRTIVKINTSQNFVMGFFEKVHTLADLLLSILLPLTLLVFMTVMIVWRLWVWPNRHRRHLLANEKAQVQANSLLSAAAHQERKKRENHFAAEKRGVTRITLITCFIQLLTETPSMSVLIYVSMYGVNVHREGYICTWQTLSYFLCLCNASLSFFVYITFSTRFRKTMLHRARQMLHRLCPVIFSEVSESNSGVLNRPKWHQPMPNSSVTHSQMVTMTSKNNSPRNGSQCHGCQQQTNVNGTKCDNKRTLVVQTTGDANGGNANGGGVATVLTNITALATANEKPQPKEQTEQQMAQSGHSSKKSSTHSNVQQQPTGDTAAFSKFANFSLAKRFLQQKLADGESKTSPIEKFCEGENMTETVTSQDSIPLKAADKRAWTNAINGGQIEGTEGNGSRKQSEMAKRSSVSSTLTNSQCDAFL
ncbi:hypothetical protein niasHT_017035 [Heterodera trifolii]|uniref:G-protein coupled receptors family 1 profile domain-containing protein n=1 Tax=Heterodera trifolii TaxID=157864 RepID=A0ABD2KY41_9BILA